MLACIYGNCRSVALLTVLCVGAAAVAYAGENAGRPSVSTSTPTVAPVQVPAYFEQNDGQFPAEVKFVARMSGYTAWFSRHDVTLTAGDSKDDARVRMRLVESGGDLIGVDRLPGKVNYFVGSDPAKWHRGVPIYGRITRKRAYPGIDVVYRIDGDELEYDLVMSPGANPDDINLQFSGAKRIRIDSAGNLILSTAAGEIRQLKPNVYQDDAGSRDTLNGQFIWRRRGRHGRVGFEITKYDPSKPLIIDPAIIYSTYLGGSSGGSTTGNAVAVFTDPSSNRVYAYIAGGTNQIDFPVLNAEQPILAGGDAFVSKFDATASGQASLIYSTFLGGNGGDSASGIAVDAAGNAYVTGTTTSTDFPTRNAYQSNIKFGFLCGSSTGGCGQGAVDGFLTKLSSDGTTLLYSTYFGGSAQDTIHAIALDAAGRAYIGGETVSQDLPILNAFQATPQHIPGDDAFGTGFVAAFDTMQSGASSLLYATYLGAACSNLSNLFCGDAVRAIAVDSSGAVHVGGFTFSTNFPIRNGFLTSSAPHGDAFYARLNPWVGAASQLTYSTYLDTAGPCGFAVDLQGNAYWATTNGPDNPMVAKINPMLSGSASLIYLTSLGTGGTPTGLAVDASGDVFVSGSNGVSGPNTAGIPVLVNPTQNSPNGVFQTLDSCVTWTGLTQGLPGGQVISLAIDTSTSPRTLYAASAGQPSSPMSVYRSIDGGLNWSPVLQVPLPVNSSGCASAVVCAPIAVDPTIPSNVYAGTPSGVYKSVDRGATWNPFSDGLSSPNVRGLAFDTETQNGSPVGILYAGTTGGLYVLGPNMSTWAATPITADVHHISFDPNTTPHTIFVASENSNSGYRSTDGGMIWTPIETPGGCLTSVTVDPSTKPSTLYGQDQAYCVGGQFLFTSTDEGNTWTVVSGPNNDDIIIDHPDTTPVIDTTQSPSIVYMDAQNGLAKSTDEFATWTAVAPTAQLGILALDLTTGSSISPATLYAGTSNNTNAAGFVAELNPLGSALLFSTYIGGILGDTNANGLALDQSGNVYVTGWTDSPYFPGISGYQSSNPVPFNQIAFFTKLGSQTLPQSSTGTVTSQVGVQTGTLAVTLPNISGSSTSSAPTLSATPLSSAATANFELSNNLGAYDITTTAVYSGAATLCFQALTVNDPTTFSNLTLLHIVNGVAQNITSSYNFATRTICGTTTSFSPFILVKGAVGQIQDLITAVNNLDLKKGIQASLDAKLQNALAGYISAASHNYASVCGVMGGFMNAVQAQTGQVLTAAEAAPLISSAQQIKATVGCP